MFTTGIVHTLSPVPRNLHTEPSFSGDPRPLNVEQQPEILCLVLNYIFKEQHEDCGRSLMNRPHFLKGQWSKMSDVAERAGLQITEP